MEKIIAVIILSLAVSAVSVTITKGAIFEKIRCAIEKRSCFFGELVRCPYCTSHWLSFAVVLVYQPLLVSSGNLIADLIITAFAIVALAAMATRLIVPQATRKVTEDQSLIEENEALRQTLEQAKNKLVEQAELIKSLTDK